MTPELIAARANLAAIVGNASPGLERLRAQLAVVAAENADAIGEEYDTRQLSGCLAAALSDADRRGDDRGTTLYGGKLIGVLSDLADAGDEAAALAVNECVPQLSALIVGLGREYARQRKGQR